MPYALDKPCRWTGCPALVKSGVGYCPEHKRETRKQSDRQRDQSNRHVYATARWKRLRKMVLGRDPTCPCGDGTTVADHIVPMSRGGQPYDLDNVQGMCDRCHNRKTAREDGGYGR